MEKEQTRNLKPLHEVPCLVLHHRFIHSDSLSTVIYDFASSAIPVCSYGKLVYKGKHTVASTMRLVNQTSSVTLLGLLSQVNAKSRDKVFNVLNPKF